MKGILIRVAVDSVYGKWNAPVNSDTGDFVYIPIPESQKTQFNPNYITTYNDFLPALKKFSLKNNTDVQLPSQLADRNTHLDPDFSYLTYGDNGKRRGKKLVDEFDKGDFIVFYAGLKPINSFSIGLYYGIIGLYVIEQVDEVQNVSSKEYYKNAHTRKVNPEPSDVIITADPEKSGRLDKSILIGEFRDRAYRIRKELDSKWGGLTVKDGYIQRSAVPPRFNDPAKFLKWFDKQKVQLINRNN